MANIPYEVTKIDRTDWRNPKWEKIIIEIPEDNSPLSVSMLNEIVDKGVILEKFEYVTKNGFDCKTDNLAYALKRKNKHSVKAVVSNNYNRAKGINTAPYWLRWRIYSDEEYQRYYVDK